MGNNLYWLWLSLHCSSHSTLFDRLIRVFRSPEEIYRADSADLATVAGEKSPEILRLSDKNLSDSQRIMEHCMMSDVQILSYGNAAYPARLRLLENPPLVLYVKGKLPVFEESLLITVVGTRRMSDYGKRMTFEISYDLARAGAVVVTGMALGVDGLASASAMEAGGRTLAFLGCGIDIAYPSEHAYLMRRIIESGAVLTEYPPGTRPEGRNFPHRNRLMSGVSHGVLMVEGNRKSGALITAYAALEQGRDVFAVPGSPGVKTCGGNLNLLREGAILVRNAVDILQEYEGPYPDLVARCVQAQQELDARAESARPETPPPAAEEPGPEPIPQTVLDAMSPEEQRICALLQARGNMQIDNLVAETGIPAGQALAALTLLEVKGVVRRLPARYFTLAGVAKCK